MRRVLVTGVNGFVGQHLARHLSENDIEVFGVGGNKKVTEQPSYISNYQILNLNSSQQAQQINFKGIDGVIHLAGLAAVGPSFDKPNEYLQTNMGIQVNLMEASLAQKASPIFLVVSSGTLYDPNDEMPLNEESVVVPSSPYSVSKLGQEQLAQYYGQRGFKCIIARPFNHTGPGQKEGFILPDLTKQIVDVEKGVVDRVLVGNLDAKRDYTDVRDIVRAYRLLLEKGRPSEIYNISSGKALSGQEILDKLLRLSSAKPSIIKDLTKMRPTDAPVIYGDHKKLTRDTGWLPEIGLDTTIKDVLEDWRSRS